MKYSPSKYADLTRVINDKNYADEKHLIVKKNNLPENDLFIIQYNKTFLNNENINTLGLFRSIIVDKNGKIKSFSPPKSLTIDGFKNSVSGDDIEYSEFCEGTMINLFRNKDDWELSTKSTIGARSKFFQEYPKTFRYLFLEILNDKGIELDNFDTNKVYSFVIQHPDNRIVVPFEKMDLKLVQIYEITETNDIISCETIQIIKSLICQNNINIETPLPLNKIIECSDCSVDEIQSKFSGLNMSWKIVGAVITNTKTGERTKIRNPSYEYVKKLKGNNPKIQFQYYALRAKNKVREYLKYYPEKKREFSKLRAQLHQWTQQLYKNYISCYIKKETPLKNFPYEFKTHMFKLHEIYKENLKPKKSYVSKSVVVDYVNNLEPPRLMHVINYKLRKNIVENNANDTAGQIQGN